MPEYSTFGMCTVVDGKAVINCDTVPLTGLGLGTEAAKPVLGIDLTIPESTSGYDAPKPSAMAGAGADPATPGGLDELDVK